MLPQSSIVNLKLFDTHAHLHSEDFDRDREDVIKRAYERGVESIIEIGSGEGLKDILSSLELSKRYPFIYTTIGIHPHNAKDLTEAILLKIRSLAGDPRVVGIGETGLDYHYLNSPKEAQKKAFKALITVAKEARLPLILHIRDAYRDAIEILRKEEAFEVGGIIHCFSGTYEDAEELMAMGLYISFSGVVTFPKAEGLRKVVRMVPIERILIETDCPYLAPQPFRGKRNEPAFVYYVAETIAKEKGLTLKDVARITTLNAKEIFRIGDYKERRVEIAYPIRHSLYLNITNRCTNYCTFCAKFKGYVVKGHYLRLEKEPTVKEVISSLSLYLSSTQRWGEEEGGGGYKEVVFCGFGEPLLRLDVVIDVARWLKQRGMRVRIDTDGLANLVHGRNILPELKGLVDAISVSLNAPDEETYARYCISRYGRSAFRAVKDFIKESKRYITEVTATVVALPHLDLEACRRVAEDELGVRFRIRGYNEVG